MRSSRTGKGPRASWLLVPLIVLAAGGRQVCWCAGQESHCGGGRTEAPDRASCHGQEHGRELSQRERPAPPAPCSRGHSCGCLHAADPAAPAPEAPALRHPAVAGWAAVPFAHAFALPRQVRTAVVPRRPPRDDSPPRFVVNCAFRC